MKWVVAAIALFIVGYTIVNIYLRKPGRAYRPYQDSQDRATVARLLAAGWKKLPVEPRRPVESPTAEAPAAISRGGPGLGADLAPHFAEAPRLLASIDRVVGPSVVSHGRDYVAYFSASLSNLKYQVGEWALYHQGHELVLVPSLEALPGKDLMSRRNASAYAISFPTATLPPGRYAMRIVAQGPAAMWNFEVR